MGAIQACIGTTVVGPGLAVGIVLDNEVFTISNASFTVYNNGYMGYSANTIADGPDYWFNPPGTAGTGDSYWVRLSLDSGDAWYSGPADGVAVALSTSRTWLWRAPLGATFKEAYATLDIATDEAMTNIVATCSVYAYAEYVV